MPTIRPDQEICDILAQYFTHTNWQLRSTGDAGTNNITQFVDTPDGSYVLRVYQNEHTLDVVRYEHELLERLAEKELSFQIPHLVRTHDGSTYATTASRQYGALFTLISGVHPSKSNPDHVRMIGAAIGELSLALGTVELTNRSAYSGYYEIFKTHPSVTRESLAQFLTDPQHGVAPEKAERLHAAVRACEAEIEQFHHLPKQTIHGDVTAGNTLIEGNCISGILDFEFAATDFREMEMAVFFVGLIGDDELAWTRMEAFLAGYGSHLKVSRDEIAALPLFLKLRKLVSFLHRLGRVMTGHDRLEDATVKIDEYLHTEEWLAENRDRLLRLCERHILEG